MGDVELEFDVSRIGGRKDLFDFLGPLAHRVHVVVIPERDAEIRRSLADLGEQAPEALIVGGGKRPFGTLVDGLQIQPAAVVHKLRVRDVHRDLLRFDGRINHHVAARQRDEREVMPGQFVGQGARPRLVLGQDVRSELNAGIPGIGDVGNRRRVLAAPGNRRVPDPDIGWGRRDRRVEVREIGGRIQRRRKQAGDGARGRRRGRHRRARGKQEGPT